MCLNVICLSLFLDIRQSVLRLVIIECIQFCPSHMCHFNDTQHLVFHDA